MNVQKLNDKLLLDCFYSAAIRETEMSMRGEDPNRQLHVNQQRKELALEIIRRLEAK